MPQLPSVSELLVGGHIQPLRSSNSSPETQPSSGSSPRQQDSHISMFHPRSSGTASSPTALKPHVDSAGQKRIDALPLPSSRRASAEYAAPAYDRSYVVHTVPSSDYFSYREPLSHRPLPDSRQHSPEHLHRIPSYNSAASSESIHKMGDTPPAVSSPDFLTRPRPASFSHMPITNILYTGPKGATPMPVAMTNVPFPHAPATAGNSPHGGVPVYGVNPYPLMPNGLYAMNVHAGNAPGNHMPPGPGPQAHMQMYPASFENESRDQNNTLVNKRRVTKRRTRSGCMTCRKRRIKCDERKPHCFNCERSKKLCLGYELASTTRRSESDLKSKARLSVQSLM